MLLHQNKTKMKKQQNLSSFMPKYGTEEKCFNYLVYQKWSKGFKCSKCGCTEAIKGRTWHHKRCKSCKYDESCTANTMFHKIKIPLPTAFAIIYQLSTMKKGMSTCEIARQHGIHQETAWFFKRKVQSAMNAFEQKSLSWIVEVDEAVIGGYEKGKQGRSHGTKKPVMMALEIGNYDQRKGRSQLLRAQTISIDDYSSETLKSAIDEVIDQDTVIISDGWKAYPKATGDRVHLGILSENGSNMPEIHRMIFNLKNWLRGTHHHVSKEHLQNYLNEFFFRFNYRSLKNLVAFFVLKKMTFHHQTPYISLVAS
jgi:transposase-like protein